MTLPLTTTIMYAPFGCKVWECAGAARSCHLEQGDKNQAAAALPAIGLYAIHTSCFVCILQHLVLRHSDNGLSRTVNHTAS